MKYWSASILLIVMLLSSCGGKPTPAPNSALNGTDPSLQSQQAQTQLSEEELVKREINNIDYNTKNIAMRFEFEGNDINQATQWDDFAFTDVKTILKDDVVWKKLSAEGKFLAAYEGQSKTNPQIKYRIEVYQYERPRIPDAAKNDWFTQAKIKLPNDKVSAVISNTLQQGISGLKDVDLFNYNQNQNYQAMLAARVVISDDDPNKWDDFYFINKFSEIQNLIKEGLIFVEATDPILQGTSSSFQAKSLKDSRIHYFVRFPRREYDDAYYWAEKNNWYNEAKSRMNGKEGWNKLINRFKSDLTIWESLLVQAYHDEEWYECDRDKLAGLLNEHKTALKQNIMIYTKNPHHPQNGTFNFVNRSNNKRLTENGMVITVNCRKMDQSLSEQKKEEERINKLKSLPRRVVK